MKKVLFIAVLAQAAFGACRHHARDLTDWSTWVTGVIEHGFLQRDFDLVLGGGLPERGTPAFEQLRSAIQENFPRAVKSVALEPDHYLLEKSAVDFAKEITERLKDEMAEDWDDTPSESLWKKRFPPRRGLELTLYYLLQPARTMEELSREIGPARAFVHFLEIQKSEFLNELYYTNGAAILHWALDMRAVLRNFGPDAAMYLSGSFVGGRSKPGSDIDGVAYLRRVDKKLFRELLSGSLKRYGFRGVIPGVSTMPVDKKPDEVPGLGIPQLFSPWHLWITPTEVRIVVYPQHTNLHFDLSTQELVAHGALAEPQVFTIP